MKEAIIEKVTLNIGTGEPGVKLDNAMLLLKNITGTKPIQTLSKKRIPTWKIRPGLPIGCKVTIRNIEAEKLLKRLLVAKNQTLKKKSFNQGGVSFGIAEYIEIPKVEYDPKIGIIGLDVAVTLKRKGFRIKHRRIKKKKITEKNLISKEETIQFMTSKFGVDLI